jgi:hypothetical protein
MTLSKSWSVECHKGGALGTSCFVEYKSWGTRQSIFLNTLSSACQWALGKDVFAECRIQDTWQSIFLNFLKNLCRVSDRGHPAKKLHIQTARPSPSPFTFTPMAATTTVPVLPERHQRHPRPPPRARPTVDPPPPSVRPHAPGPPLPLHRRSAAPMRSTRRPPALHA